MSSISSVNAATEPSQTTTPSGFRQIVEGIEVIGRALQSGDVSSAKNALTALQQALQASAQSSLQNATSQLFGKNSQANTDYKNLTHALQSGDLSTAQQAYASLQNDLKPAHIVHHQHPHSSNATLSTSSSTPPTLGSATSSAINAKGNLNLLA
jgi:ribosomal protein S20